VVLSSLLLAGAVPGVARGDDWDDEDEYEDDDEDEDVAARAVLFPERDALEIAPAIVVGLLPFGAYDAATLGFALEVGRRTQRTLLYGVYELLPMDGKIADRDDSDDDHKALTQRLGGGIRYDLVRDRSNHGSDLYALSLGASLGIEHLRWQDDGPAITRPDLVLDFQVQYATTARVHKYFGFTAGLRVVLTRAPEVHMAAGRCSGPCVSAESRRLDIGVLYAVGFPFGR
jgi:hypothetical protein